MTHNLNRQFDKLFDDSLTVEAYRFRDPWFNDVHKEMNTILHSFKNIWKSFDDKMRNELRHTEPSYKTRTLHDNSQEIKISIPAMKKKDIRVFYSPHSHMISVCAKKSSSEKYSKDDKTKHTSHTRYAWQSSIDPNIQVDRIEAKYHKNGILKIIVIPKQQPQSSHTSTSTSCAACSSSSSCSCDECCAQIDKQSVKSIPING